MRVNIEPTHWATQPAATGVNLCAADPLGRGRPCIKLVSQGAGFLRAYTGTGVVVAITVVASQELSGVWLGLDAGNGVAVACGY